MRVMITGAGGLLGSNLTSAAAQRGWDAIGTYHDPDSVGNRIAESVTLDVTDPGEVEGAVAEIDPDYVINCAAMTDVDGCEERPERAHEVNAKGPALLATCCETADVGFCQISTDYVFGDDAKSPITEDASVNPLQVYGRTKLAGERMARNRHSSPLVARLSFVFGINRCRGALAGLSRWIIDRVRAGRIVPLYTDQEITPTYANDAAETVLDLVEQSAQGTYHCSNKGYASPHEFGRYLLNRQFEQGGRNGAESGDSAEKVPGTDELISKGLMSDVDLPADRPASVCLSVQKVESELGRNQPTWRGGIDRMLAEASPE